MIDYLKKYPDQRQVALVLANADSMIPGEHIALTAENHGLSSCWVGLLDIKEASRILNLPEKYACFYLLPIGYADEEPRNIKRKTIEEITFNNSFGNKYHST
jgi:nitroreductase